MKIILILILNTVISSYAWADKSLKGSPLAQEWQNLQADADGLERLTEEKLEAFKNEGRLVSLKEIVGTKIDFRLQEKYHWCLPWTRHFLIHLGEAFFNKFGRVIQINSAVRTIEFQSELSFTNKNAASPFWGPKQSSHLTGATIDIAKIGLTKKELAWLREYLVTLEKQKLIEATEEYFQLVFHVMVFKRYMAPTGE